MTDSLAKFQQLLCELFQFDAADLDFGIYQIMNYKRHEVERFISEDLPQTVGATLDDGALAEQSQAAQELVEVAEKIRETLGADALDADGNLIAAYYGTPLGKKYLDLQGRAAGARSRDALEAQIYNHLVAFFSRYYQDGDFISKRRYSKRERYAIPYNGEEVTLYWANYDQYYVKTAEHFTDYTYTAPNGVTVHFKLQVADVEQNNVKGEKRFFLARPAETSWDEAAAQLVIPFEFRPLTEQEDITYGGKNQQEAILARALKDIPKRLPTTTAAPAVAALVAEKRVNADGDSVTHLEHHLRQYTRRNTSDFFIHKDLKGFLTRELDFYLKNEVLSLDDMEAAGEGRAEGWFQIMGAIRAVGCRIIEFLAQVEEFQKMLWEKRKFITETSYCITMGVIPVAFYPEIAACDAQWEEWHALFAIEDPKTSGERLAFLHAHPTLVLDTRHLDRNLTDRLLGSFDDLDEATEGLLIQSENWQVLNLLLTTYRNTVDCVYIDPPYNTDATPIVYKNGYRDSSWLALLRDRMALACFLTTNETITCVTIDDVEVHYLRVLLERVLPEQQLLGAVAIKNNPAGRTGTVGFSICHEYALFYGEPGVARVGRLRHSEAQKSRYKERDDISTFEWTNFRKHGGLNTYRATRPRQFYPIYVKEESIRIPQMKWDNSARAWRILESPTEGEEVVLPIDEAGRERIWDFVVDTARAQLVHLRVRKDTHGATAIYRKWRLNKEGMLPQTVWDKSEYSAAEYGTNLLANIFGETHRFTFPKSVHAVADCLRVANLRDTACGTALDYFAGSGTTGHAVINLNREDGGRRKFILVEMADYFDTVMLPRIKKVTYTPEWKDGKPKRTATSEEGERGPRIVKVIRLESYEDALNNIVFDSASGQQVMQFDDYLLQYMLKWEARASETLLNVEQLARPFDYKLHIHDDGQTSVKPVDIPETFAYLLGLHVQTRRAYDDSGRRYLVYRGTIDHRQVVVIWRETEGWGQADYERDRQFVAEHKLAEDAHKVFVNGDSLISNAQALEPLFKTRMFAPVEA